jgi:hypothetical protein
VAGRDPEPGNAPGIEVGETALRTANRFVHSIVAWFVRRRRAREERRRDQRSKILPKSSGSLATILSRAIFARARHEFDIYRIKGEAQVIRTASFFSRQTLEFRTITLG